MTESTIVRENLMTQEGYRPYCGSLNGCDNPRTSWNGEQFVCPYCGWTSQFPNDFISRYKDKWNLRLHPTNPNLPGWIK
jgi:hypothetical protein